MRRSPELTVPGALYKWAQRWKQHQSITTVKISQDTKVNSQSTKETTRELQQVESSEKQRRGSLQGDRYVETFGIGIPGISRN